MVCAHCGSESHRTGDSSCKGYCTLCAQSGHRQQRGTCPYRVCNTCGETGHSARECNPRCKACGSSDHRNSSSFACPEHKCSKCKGALDPKGHNKNNCPGSAVCEAVCEACGSSDHRNAKSFECPEHKCTKCKGTLDPKGHNKNNCPEMLNTICTLCEAVGHDEKRCPTKPCPACGNRTHKSPMHFECPEHICATCGEKGHNRTNCPTTQCENMRSLWAPS